MIEQFTIDGTSTFPGLTDHQTLVWRIVIDAGAGITADEAGAHIHEANAKHSAGEICEWCGSAGGQVLRALQKKKLVTRRRDGLWTPPGKREKPTRPEPTDAFPAGF